MELELNLGPVDGENVESVMASNIPRTTSLPNIQVIPGNSYKQTKVIRLIRPMESLKWRNCRNMKGNFMLLGTTNPTCIDRYCI